MIRRLFPAAILLAGLSACSADAPASTTEAETKTELPSEALLPAVAAPAAHRPEAGSAAPLRDWLIGAWSYEGSCASDFFVRYDADGSVANAGDTGSWTLDGDTVTERITERFEPDEDSEAGGGEPEVRSYRIERTGADRGTIVIDDRRVPIIRC
ncbi:hypothetical protein [Sphingosinithalassobacter sp. LHW66-3]|uniref:hypothetical protein n=1 Tax=Sphingosinithalassobacter sp. LHW66-3 TaxID=3424718 RepID=UPI003D6B44CA